MTPQPPAAPAKRARLTRAAEFDAVSRLGRAVGGRYLTVRYRHRDDDAAARVGFAVPRQVGGAVERNAVKRRLREVLDRDPALLRPGYDYVVIARGGIAEPLALNGQGWLAGQLAELLDRIPA
jgi:ribonuclease P protein component